MRERDVKDGRADCRAAGRVENCHLFAEYYLKKSCLPSDVEIVR